MYAARSASLGGLRAVRWNWRYSLETSALGATKPRRRRWSALRPQCRTRCAHGQVRPWLVGVGRWVPQAAMAVTAERYEERDRISLFRYGFTVVIRTVIAIAHSADRAYTPSVVGASHCLAAPTTSETSCSTFQGPRVRSVCPKLAPPRALARCRIFQSLAASPSASNSARADARRQR
jgi:hypothetical protein